MVTATSRAGSPSAMLAAAAACVVLSLGVTWSSDPGTAGIVTPGTTVLTNQYNPFTGYLDLVPQYQMGFYLPGAPGTASSGYADDVRVGLVPALAALGWALVRPSPTRRRLTLVAALALAVCAAWGFGHGLVRGPLLALVAAGLALAAHRSNRRRGRSPTTLDAAGYPGSVGPAVARSTF